MTEPTSEYVPVAGLLVPALLVPRITAAVRGTYPTLTAGRDDEGAVRALVRHWLAETLSTYEATVAGDGAEEALAALRQQYADAADAARLQATADAALIVEPPTATV